MAAPVFGKRWYAKTTSERAEARATFRTAVATARAGKDEAIRQNMEMFEKITPKLQDMYLHMRDVGGKNVPPSEKDIADWQEDVKEVLKDIHDRIFVVMTAQLKGWSFARKLDFYQSCDKADKHFAKVAKKFAKRDEKKASAERAGRQKKGRGAAGPPRGYYHPHAHPYAQWAPPTMPAYGWPQPPVLAALGAPPPGPPPPQPPPAPGPRLSKAYLRCNSCGEFGHFAKECPMGPKVSLSDSAKMEETLSARESHDIVKQEFQDFKPELIHADEVRKFWTHDLIKKEEAHIF